MQPSHPYTAAILVPADLVEEAELIAGEALGRPCWGEITAQLSAEGSRPGSHRWAAAGLTPAEYGALLAAFFTPGSPGAALGVQVYTLLLAGWDDRPGATVEIGGEAHPVDRIDLGDPLPTGHPLARRWTLARVLAEVGLRPVSGPPWGLLK